MSSQVAAQHAAQAATPERVLAGKGPEVDGPVLDRTEDLRLETLRSDSRMRRALVWIADSKFGLLSVSRG